MALHFSTHKNALCLHFSTHVYSEILHFLTHDTITKLHFSTHKTKYSTSFYNICSLVTYVSSSLLNLKLNTLQYHVIYFYYNSVKPFLPICELNAYCFYQNSLQKVFWRGEKRYASCEKKNTRKNEKNAIRWPAICELQVIPSHSFRCFYSLFFMYTYFTVI